MLERVCNKIYQPQGSPNLSHKKATIARLEHTATENWHRAKFFQESGVHCAELKQCSFQLQVQMLKIQRPLDLDQLSACSYIC